MSALQLNIIFLSIFATIGFASKELGNRFKQINLPLISGYLIAGILAGPYVLNMISQEAATHLAYLDEISLGFIAFAAGSELFWKELSGRLRSITWIIAGQTVVIFSLTAVAIILLAPYIPFIAGKEFPVIFGASIMLAAIMVARSPSSAIAIIRELRARGPFTQTIMGVTVLSDVVVIALFAFTASVSDALLTDTGINLIFFLLLLLELALALGIGYIAHWLVRLVVARNIPQWIKSSWILAVGYSVFLFSDFFRHFTHDLNGIPEILIEPLMVCMVAGFLITNLSTHKNEFHTLLNKTGPIIYIIFFTLTGASLSLKLLLATWPIALAIFGVRLIGILAGSFVGGTIAGDPSKHNKISWLAYITQAGVALGLAKEVAVEFPVFGNEFATLAISVIVINQLLGPPLFKYAVRFIGESHEKGNEPREFDGVRDAIIFGLEDQSMAVAEQLIKHNWEVKVICIGKTDFTSNGNPRIKIISIPEISLETLESLNAKNADAMVALLTDEENLALCELFYSHFPIDSMVVRLNDREYGTKFDELNALIVHPSTAIVGLMDHMVRSPNATSLLLGMDEDSGRDIMEIEITNPSMNGKALRDLQLPLDVLILQICRDDRTLISQGFTRLQVGDEVTVLGYQESLAEVIFKFEK